MLQALKEIKCKIFLLSFFFKLIRDNFLQEQVCLPVPAPGNNKMKVLWSTESKYPQRQWVTKNFVEVIFPLHYKSNRAILKFDFLPDIFPREGKRPC